MDQNEKSVINVIIDVIVNFFISLGKSFIDFFVNLYIGYKDEPLKLAVLLIGIASIGGLAISASHNLIIRWADSDYLGLIYFLFTIFGVVSLFMVLKVKEGNVIALIFFIFITLIVIGLAITYVTILNDIDHQLLIDRSYEVSFLYYRIASVIIQIICYFAGSVLSLIFFQSKNKQLHSVVIDEEEVVETIDKQ